MNPTPSRTGVQAIPKWERVRLAILCSLLLACVLGGGASRADTLSLLFLRPWAIVCAVALLLLPQWPGLGKARTPLMFVVALAALMAVQLVPLPPAIWASLPGHAQFYEAASAAGLDQPWRPISVSPDWTLNSLVSLVVPAAALLGLAGTPSAGSRAILLGALLLAVLASAVLGIFQFVAGENSPLYLYRITNRLAPVGFLANRNHQATLLACAFPLVAAWTALGARARAGPKHGASQVRSLLLLAGGALLISVVVLTGSRAGVVLSALGLGAAAFIIRRTGDAKLVHSVPNRWLRLMPVALGGLLVALFYGMSRAPSLQRLFAGSVGEDERLQSLPLLLDITLRYMPFGSGFGTFDPVYRIHEPYDRLDQQYLNHAHNDLVELALTAGVPGLVLAGAFLVWFARRCWILNRESRPTPALAPSLAGAAVLGILLLASLADYPLRTPLMMMVGAIAAVWTNNASSRG